MAKWPMVNVYLQRLLMYVSFQKLYVTFLLFKGQAQLSGILEVLVLFCDRVSCNLTSPLAGSIVEDDHELLFFPPMCWDCRCELPCPTWGFLLNKISSRNLCQFEVENGVSYLGCVVPLCPDLDTEMSSFLF